MTDVLIRKLVAADEQQLVAFLRPRIESSMFLYGNAQQAGLVNKGRRLQGNYVAAIVKGQIVSVIAHYWNGNIVFQAPVHLEQLLMELWETTELPIVGFIGPNEQVIQAMKLLKVSEDLIRHDEAERLYSLALKDLITPAILHQSNVTWRRARDEDLELLTHWLVAMNVETLQAVESPTLYQNRRSSVRRIIDQGNTWILEIDGLPVSTSGFNAQVELSPSKRIVQIGGVYTPTEYRNRGYARAIVAASLLDSRADLVTKAILFTAESNVAAQKAYTALGFQPVGTYRLAFLNRPVIK